LEFLLLLRVLFQHILGLLRAEGIIVIHLLVSTSCVGTILFGLDGIVEGSCDILDLLVNVL